MTISIISMFTGKYYMNLLDVMKIIVSSIGQNNKLLYKIAVIVVETEDL